ncbi:PREDICTED: melanocortin receptor 5-like [Priapulus caudatus]|uniref:Melanocortin receptor 5-like n=1 Tax=Priapulus caudatus TaxID=37621 RepID=A0ABM1EQR3_PRICU|nr:PREDICTED: melanocortin receptor 5-like [Priapulus caudatus]
MDVTLFSNESNLTISSHRNNADEDYSDDANITAIKTHTRSLNVPLFVLGSLFTAVGNGLVITVIAKIHRLRTAANMTIANLACCDFALGSTLWTGVLRRDTMPRCAVFTGFAMTLFQLSLMDIALCTINRYVAIVYPLRYNQLMNPARTGVLITLSTTYAIVIGIAAAIQVSYRWEPPSICIVDLELSPGFAYVFSSHYIILFIFMTYCYVVIARIVWDHTRRMAAASDEERENMSAFHATLKMSKILLTVGGTSFTLLTPHVLHFILIHSFPFRLRTLRFIRLNAIVLNSLMNPIIYFYKYKDFRLAVRELFGCATSTVNPSQPNVEQDP